MKRYFIIALFPFLTSCDPWTMSLIAGLGGLAGGYLTRDTGYAVKAPIVREPTPKELEALYERKIERLEQRMEQMEVESSVMRKQLNQKNDGT